MSTDPANTEPLSSDPNEPRTEEQANLERIDPANLVQAVDEQDWTSADIVVESDH